jgi:hypothetical protein
VDDKNLHRDVAHPITQEMRDYIHNKVIDAYKAELGKSPSESAAPAVKEKEPEVKKGLFGRPIRSETASKQAGGKTKAKEEKKEAKK